jgi:hypothetical protein
VQILPFMCEHQLYRQIRQDEPWDSPHNRQFHDKMPSVFQAPGIDLPPGQTVYLAVRGSDSALADPTNPQDEPREQVGFKLDDMRDGTTNVIMIVEADADRAVPWMKPDDFVFDPADPVRGLGAARGGSFLVVFVDGHVKPVPTSIDHARLIDLFGKANGEPPPTFPFIPLRP